MPAARIPDAIKRVFLQAFTARDVAEPLASFDAGVAAADVHTFMKSRGYDVVGVREQGDVVGYVDGDSLTDGACGQNRRPLDTAAVLNDTVPLLTVLMELNQAPFLFITAFGKVGGIITHSDLQKPPVRMWLFGIVTMIEMHCTSL